MFTIPLRLAGRVMIAAVLALAGAATPALAAPIGDGTSNTIQLAVTESDGIYPAPAL